MGPFPCTNCGRILLIDRIKAVEDGEMQDIKQFSVDIVLDNASMTSEAGNDFLKGEWAGKGRKDLVKEIYRLRHEVKTLRALKTPLFHKHRSAFRDTWV